MPEIKTPKKRGPAWDVEAGKKMYDAGMSPRYIAQAVGTSEANIKTYAGKHWTPAALARRMVKEG